MQQCPCSSVHAAVFTSEWVSAVCVVFILGGIVFSTQCRAAVGISEWIAWGHCKVAECLLEHIRPIEWLNAC
jgi:hypothetical protein